MKSFLTLSFLLGFALSKHTFESLTSETFTLLNEKHGDHLSTESLFYGSVPQQLLGDAVCNTWTDERYQVHTECQWNVTDESGSHSYWREDVTGSDASYDYKFGNVYGLTDGSFEQWWEWNE